MKLLNIIEEQVACDNFWTLWIFMKKQIAKNSDLNELIFNDSILKELLNIKIPYDTISCSLEKYGKSFKETYTIYKSWYNEFYSLSFIYNDETLVNFKATMPNINEEKIDCFYNTFYPLYVKTIDISVDFLSDKVIRVTKSKKGNFLGNYVVDSEEKEKMYFLDGENIISKKVHSLNGSSIIIEEMYQRNGVKYQRVFDQTCKERPYIYFKEEQESLYGLGKTTFRSKSDISTNRFNKEMKGSLSQIRSLVKKDSK